MTAMPPIIHMLEPPIIAVIPRDPGARRGCEVSEVN